MDALQAQKLTVNTYFDPHSWEFSDSTSMYRKGLIKIPTWCVPPLCPLMGLLYLVCVPPVLVCTVAVAFPRLLRKMIRRSTSGDDGSGSPRKVLMELTSDNIGSRHPDAANAEDRKLARDIIKELEREFTARRHGD